MPFFPYYKELFLSMERKSIGRNKHCWWENKQKSWERGNKKKYPPKKATHFFQSTNFKGFKSKNKSRKCTIARRISICKENAIHIDRSSARNPPEMWSHELPKDSRIHGKMRSHTRTWANLQAGSPWTQKSRLHRDLFWCYRGARASIGSKRAWSVHHIYFCQNYFWSCAQMV